MTVGTPSNWQREINFLRCSAINFRDSPSIDANQSENVRFKTGSHVLAQVRK